MAQIKLAIIALTCIATYSCSKVVSVAPVEFDGQFEVFGCAATDKRGGSSAGSFVSFGSRNCTVRLVAVCTSGPCTAADGTLCYAIDVTSAAPWRMTASNAWGCSISSEHESTGHTIMWAARMYKVEP